MDLKCRLRNYGFWVSVASLIGMLLKQTGVLAPNDPTWDAVVTSVLGILIAMGIISNPTTAHPWYADDRVPPGDSESPVN